MFDWLTGKKKGNGGPDYSAIDSREKAEALFRSGQLQKILLLPSEFGGADILANVVFVPSFAAELKVRTDRNVIYPLAQQGQIKRYNATPEYEGKSFIPSAINIVASDPGTFTYKIAIWGAAVKGQSAPISP